MMFKGQSLVDGQVMIDPQPGRPSGQCAASGSRRNALLVKFFDRVTLDKREPSFPFRVEWRRSEGHEE